MQVGFIGPAAGRAFLPAARVRSSAFDEALRSQIRTELAQGLAGGQDAQRPLSPPYGQRAPDSTVTLASDSGHWADLARSIGGKYLSPSVADLFTRQMALESGNFSPDVISGRVVSSAGAQGIAQLMPASYPTVNRLDPVASLNAAAATMRDNLARYGGDARKALAAYNAGTGTIDGLTARYGTTWEAGLPDETRRYLQLLLG